MKYTFLPKTKMGKISVWSFVTFIVTWTVFPFSLVIAGIIAVFVGFVTGIIALFREKDRSILLIIVTLLCFLISGFMLLYMIDGFVS